MIVQTEGWIRELKKEKTNEGVTRAKRKPSMQIQIQSTGGGN